MKTVYLVTGIRGEFEDTLAVYGDREAAYKFVEEYKNISKLDPKDKWSYDSYIVQQWKVR